MRPGISVIVPCFNSRARLAPTLAHLANQKNIPLSHWEVIIVDNASTDSTAEFSLETWNAHVGDKPDFKVVKEMTQGLSFARKKGIHEARFDYVLFCDDDNWLDENYLSTALKILETSSKIGVLGGTGLPVFEDKEPPYFWANQYHALAVGRQSEKEGDITDTIKPVVYGAAMFVNKKAFDILEQEFDFQFQLPDRVGNSLSSSGDYELCMAMAKIGYRIFYSDELRFKHFIPSNRTTIKYYKKLFLNFGISYAVMHVYRVNKNNINNIKNDYRYICLRCIKNIFLMNTYLFFKGYYFGINKYRHIDYMHQLYDSLGMFRTFLKSKNSFKQQFNNLPLFAHQPITHD